MGVKIRKRNGKWYVFVNWHGHRKARCVGTSREAAEHVRIEIEKRLALGTFDLTDHPNVPTFTQYAEAWAKHRQYELKPPTLSFYKQYLRLYIEPAFGQYRLDEIRREDAKKWITGLMDRGLARNTVRLAVATLRVIMNGAIEDGLLESNPVQGLGKFVKSQKAEREATALKPSEAERLLLAAKESCPEHYPMLLAALRGGLRQGELAALRWGDIQFGDSEDEPDRYILVQRTYDRRWSRKMLTPKSKRSRRVDMSRELRRVLLELRDERLVKAFAEGKSDISEELVFPSEARTPMEMNNFCERVFKPLLAHARVRRIRFHDLRHTFGSLLLQAGAPLTYVKEQMGHSSIKVTVDIYGHLIPGADVAYMDRLDRPATKTSPQQSATPAQPSEGTEVNQVEQVVSDQWLGGRDSNPDTQIQSLQSYR